MTTFEELKDTVKKKGFGTALYGNVNGDPVYLSRGVREEFMSEEENMQPVIEAVEKFEAADYGSAVEYGKSIHKGHEYGRYAISSLTSETEDTGVWVHRAEDAILVYFKFER
ncbi:MAG: hypothetical protein VZR02_05290 [Lachnospiraceae bacterium]|nr:hypothetical protein [Lachnospiraceae bacterium]